MKSQRSPLFRILERLQYAALALSMLAVIAPIALVLYYLITKGLPAINWTFLSQPPEDQMKGGGIMPAIVGTLYLLLGTFLFALPLGLFGAVYITEYGRGSKFTRLLRLAIVNLAGVPSIVYGLFGLGFFVGVVGTGIDKTFHHAPALRASDIKDVESFALRVEEKKTPLDVYLNAAVSPRTWQDTTAYRAAIEEQGRRTAAYAAEMEKKAPEAVVGPLRQASEAQDKRVENLGKDLAGRFANELNPLLRSADFYQPDRFAPVEISDNLKARAGRKPSGEALVQVNREILEEGLEGEIGGYRRLTFATGGIMWASLTMALLILPVVITASEEALLSVPESFRQASLGLGCTRWQTIRQVVLPNAMPGILTGMILGLSRAAGETAPILLLGASFFLPSLPEGAHSPFMALPYHLFIMSTQAVDAPERIPWGTALVLLAIALGLNAIASVFRSRARAARKW